MRIARRNIVTILVTFLLVAFCAHSLEGQIWKKVFRKGKTKSRKWARNGEDRKVLYPEDYILTKGHEVIGFEPSWLIQEGGWNKHSYNLISSLVLGEYDVNPQTGLPRNPRLLQEIQSIKKGKIKSRKGTYNGNIIEYANYINPDIRFLIHVVSTGDFGPGYRPDQEQLTESFLKNKNIRIQFFNEIRDLLISLEQKYSLPADRLGIVLDIKGFPENTIPDYVRFVRELRGSLGAEHLIYLKVPPFPYYEFPMEKDEYERFSELTNDVDRLIVECYGMENFRVGPGQELMKNEYGEFNTVSALSFYNQLGFGRDSIVPLIPFYGSKFLYDEQDSVYRLDAIRPYFPLDEPGIGISGNNSYPMDSTFTYFEYKREGKFYREYYDDFLSLDKKFGFLKDSLGLQTLGFWGLSYYQGMRNEDGYIENAYNLVAEHHGVLRPRMVWVVAGFLTTFLPLGFVYSVLNYWQVRNILAKYRKYFVRWQIGFLVSLITWVVVADLFPGARGTVGYGLAALILFIFFLRIFIRRLIAKSRRVTRYTKYIK